MPTVGFEPTITASEPPKTQALDRAATGSTTQFKSHPSDRTCQTLHDYSQILQLSTMKQVMAAWVFSRTFKVCY
jgi:hypothetical protein